MHFVSSHTCDLKNEIEKKIFHKWSFTWVICTIKVHIHVQNLSFLVLRQRCPEDILKFKYINKIIVIIRINNNTDSTGENY